MNEVRIVTIKDMEQVGETTAHYLRGQRGTIRLYFQPNDRSISPQDDIIPEKDFDLRRMKRADGSTDIFQIID